MAATREFWKGRSVLLTGHTGFKGAWLALWLHKAGARVHGFALEPPTQPSLHDVANVGQLLASDTREDLANLEALSRTVERAQPDVVFHLAAQSLVRESYREPVRTFATNAMGTAHVLEACRSASSVRAVVAVTTDKVYENRESLHRYAESDPLGGHDPYSASKAAAEIVAASYSASFYANAQPPRANVATARAGNVIGGADWAADRLVPDCLRAFAKHEPVRLRYPNAVRPWQHVLEPLSGYLKLAERLCSPEGARYADAWNFGPDADGDATVGDVAALTARLWGDGARVETSTDTNHPHEAGFLRLDTTKARDSLGWRPRWTLERALAQTVAWHRAWMSGDDMARVCDRQIDEYEAGT